MHNGATGSSLVSSSHLLEATWENALSHFRRALMECGSPLNLEHSQRIGLLFAKRVGDSEELKKWASIFDAENVPTTALLLKALVNHNQWKTAIQLLELNKDASASKELAKVLAQNLTRIGLWQETLSLTSLLSQHKSDDSSQESLEPTAASSLLLTEQKNSDSYQMATNPAFLPDEEQTSYCGFVAAVAQGFPHRRDWEKAHAVLHELQQVTDFKTQLKLFEYDIARLVHDGQQYEVVVERSRTDSRFRTSPSLLRSLLHCALALRDRSLGMQSVELLCSMGPSAISVRMFESACMLFISSDTEYSKSDLVQFESVVCYYANYILKPEIQKLVAVFCADYDLQIPVFVSANTGASLPDGKTPSLQAARTVTQLDRMATILLSQGRWKEALQVADQITSRTAQNESEEVIIKMLRANSGSWEKTLQFFAD
ncbi:hypothetical protein ABB37_07573 [Leptomonas pyrrhocoris]|uniref:Uncharacterized protein n=1 Tax=Leptomonas pyrrhocoris TaxID=157538 RepID=A0A0M9FV71_LEPPY|nr:hypothetical protein ABB37_07573 [Leptomonas pyrrhocoris]KPA76745.1 hypothetical protein ABB37_07573 [Leptomonas pyrrhocoris]|eukprot:XP_015655184.1 hypothetical protein ABB37_07573 [Leptomonas pyrrhocoris]